MECVRGVKKTKDRFIIEKERRREGRGEGTKKIQSRGGSGEWVLIQRLRRGRGREGC